VLSVRLAAAGMTQWSALEAVGVLIGRSVHRCHRRTCRDQAGDPRVGTVPGLAVCRLRVLDFQETDTTCISGDGDQRKDSMSSNPIDGLGLDFNVVAFRYGPGDEVALTHVPARADDGISRARQNVMGQHRILSNQIVEVHPSATAGV
jgi:hypothetical protein